MSDILILGYYGFKNSGDDALLLSVIQQLKKQKDDIKLTVLSNDPEETKKNYGVPSIKRYNIFSLIKNIISSKMLLVGGGTLIQDGTSTKSLMYYLFVIKTALIFGKKVMLYANGIGPLKEENYNITKKVLNKVDVITLRDGISAEELKKIGVTKPKIIITADSVFNLEPKPQDIRVMHERKKYICVSVRSFKKISDSFEDIIADACNYVYEKYGCTSVLIPFQKIKDMEISKKIKEKIHHDAVLYNNTDCGIDELFDLFSGAVMCMGMRLHSLIYASICGVPSVGLAYDPKVAGFMEYIGQKRYIDTEKLELNGLISIIDDCMENRSKISKELKTDLQDMKKRAEENAVIAVKLLNE
ncbi:MAG: polysaccharide pyruvyl transferase CsaB [Clostridia bacterium]|nr:polysaccharide pyruvyl transferase CsaB [Clostridia bacterium]